jgi:hypothetical protein
MLDKCPEKLVYYPESVRQNIEAGNIRKARLLLEEEAIKCLQDLCNTTVS